jgi:hypothetical protein
LGRPRACLSEERFDVQTGAARPRDFRDLGEASQRRPAPLAREREISERSCGAQRWLRAAGSGRSSKAWLPGVVPWQRRRCSPACRDLDVVMLFPFQTGDCDGGSLDWAGRCAGLSRRRSFAVVRVPSQQRSFLRMVAGEASPGVRSSHRSRPGGAQRSWNDVRRRRAVLAAVPSSPWPPRRRTSIPRRPESSSIRSKVLDSLLFDGSAAARRPGLVRGSPAKDLVRCRAAWKASFRLKYESPSMRAKGRSRSSSPGCADGHSSFRWSRCWKASFRLSCESARLVSDPEVRTAGALMNLDDGHRGSTSGSGVRVLEWLRAAAPGGAC